MTCPPVTFNSMLRSLIRYWKILLICLVLGIVLGFGCAKVFAGQGAAGPSGAAEALNEIDFSDIPQDRSYYSTMLSRLENAYTETSAYINAVMNTASETKEQKQTLYEQKKQLQSWYAVDYKAVARQESQMPVLVPLSLLDEEAAVLREELHDDQLKLLSAEAAADVAKSLRPPVVDNEESLSYYNAILARTLGYGDLLQQIQSEQEALTALEENKDAVRAQIRNFDEAVHAALASLQEIRKEVSETADSICLENALVLTAYPTDPETIDPVIAHGHVGVSSAENFQIIVIFSGLVGLALGTFLAVCKGAKKAELPSDSPSKESAKPN